MISWILAFVAASTLSFLVWALSPVLVGQTEPWDADVPFYSIGFLICGAAVGAVFRGRLAAIYLGAWAGQLVALVVLPSSDLAWFLLGMMTTGIGSVFFLAGAGASNLLFRLTRGPTGRGS